MILKIGGKMQTIIIEAINKFGYLGIIFLIAIENIFPPIPSEVILTFGGFVTIISNITVIGTIIASTIGSVLGAIVLYYIGRMLNEERIDKVVDSKVGKILGLKKEDIHKAFEWFDNKGKFAVFFGRFIPIIRSLVSIPAGMAKINLGLFLTLTTIGSFIWNTVLIILGRIAGASWELIAVYVGEYSDIVLIGFIIMFIFGIISFYNKKSKVVSLTKLKKGRKEISK